MTNFQLISSDGRDGRSLLIWYQSASIDRSMVGFDFSDSRVLASGDEANRARAHFANRHRIRYFQGHGFPVSAKSIGYVIYQHL